MTDISTSKEVKKEFKQTIDKLITIIGPIVKRNDKSVSKMPDISTLIKSVGSSGSIVKVFEDNLSPLQKYTFAQAYIKNIDEDMIINKFIKSTKSQWSIMENGNKAEKEQALLKIADCMDMENGSNILKSLFEKKDFLNDQEKEVILSYFETLIYYSEMYIELLKEEGRKNK